MYYAIYTYYVLRRMSLALCIIAVWFMSVLCVYVAYLTYSALRLMAYDLVFNFVCRMSYCIMSLLCLVYCVCIMHHVWCICCCSFCVLCLIHVLYVIYYALFVSYVFCLIDALGLMYYFVLVMSGLCRMSRVWCLMY